MRIKGQECSFVVTSVFGGVETAFNHVKSGEITFDREISSEGYVGGLTEEKDDIFNGVSGNIEFHEESSDIASFIQRVNEVSKRRLPGETFSVITTLRFPVGLTQRIMMSDVKFGNLPINIGSRKDFVSFKIDFAAPDATIIPSPV